MFYQLKCCEQRCCCVTVFYYNIVLEKRKVENYFCQALNNFIFEEAGGGAIRHLADRGYTARQIKDALSFPVPYEKVREAFTEHLLESGILLAEKPTECIRREKTEFVREYDKYGKPSFRRVAVSEKTGQGDLPDGRHGGAKWKEMAFSEFLLLYKEGTGKIKLPAETEHREAEKNVYIACDFGRDKAGEALQRLDQAQQEYIRGICWKNRTMYHLLDRRMLGIAMKLQKTEQAAGRAAPSEKTAKDVLSPEKAAAEEMKKGAAAPEKALAEKAAVGKVYIRH